MFYNFSVCICNYTSTVRLNHYIILCASQPIPCSADCWKTNFAGKRWPLRDLAARVTTQITFFRACSAQALPKPELKSQSVSVRNEEALPKTTKIVIIKFAGTR